jgi:hypothetical protein
VVIDDAGIMSLGLSPAKDDPPLLVDSNTVEDSPIASQGFQAVAGRGPEVAESMCGVQHIELPLGHSCNIAREPSNPACAGAVVEVSSGSVAERRNHI